MKWHFSLVLFSLFPLFLSAQKLKQVTKTFPNSKVIEKTYTVLKKKKHIKHGAYQVFFKNGQIKVDGTYVNNKKHEAWKEYNIYGELRRTRIYEQGKLISDNKHGIWKEVDQNGKLYYFDYDKNERVMPQIPIAVQYPSAARESGIAGIVKIKVKLDTECEILACKVIQSLGADFDQEALKGIKKFIEKFQYYKEDCQGFEKTFTIDFRID